MTRRQLLALLRSALFGEPADAELFTNCRWEEVSRLAGEQTVGALLLDGIEFLPKAVRPPSQLVWRQIAVTIRAENENRSQNAQVSEIISFLHKEGFSPILFKGQAVAAEYPNPLHRQCGDIDIWFADTSEAERAFRWARQRFECRWMPGEKETSFVWEGATVEFHRRLADMGYKPFQRELQRIIRTEMSRGETMTTVSSVSVMTLPPRLAALHMVVHIAYHLLNEGCGLRQFCDLALFLRNHRVELSPIPGLPTINDSIEACGLSRMAAAIGWVTHCCLGLSSTDIPFKIEPHGAELIMDDVWEGGNFGKKRYSHIAHFGFIRRKLSMLPAHYRQYRRYRRLLPYEARANFINKFLRAAKGVK